MGDDDNISRRNHMLMLLCQTIGISCTVTIPSGALTSGTTGYLLCAMTLMIIVGIPLFYMETVVSQFTGRDCISVWSIRRCLSHIGYVQILWQIIFIIYNHNIVSFLFHYFLISFEKPIPYFLCGPWSNKDCNELSKNYTVNEDCIKRKFSSSYCDQLYTTYPEYQYWRYYLLEMKKKGTLLIVWRVSLASALVCTITYMSSFKRIQSLKFFLNFITLYPIGVYVLLLTGSMMQKGVVVEYEDVLDLDFSNFVRKFRFSYMIQQVVFALTIGSGITFNFACTTHFRSPSYSNVVICTAIVTGFIVLSTCTTAMFYCPYAYHYGSKPEYIIRAQMTLLFEKVPRLVRHFKNNSIWLPLIYSSNAIIGLNTNIITFYHLLEMTRRRNSKLAKYPGLVCLVFVIMLFIVTIPLQSKYGVNLILIICRTYLNLLATFIAIIECIVFLLLYGLHRFQEDIHFMQGVQPSIAIKMGWISTTVFLCYAFCNELRNKWNNTSLVDVIGRYILLVTTGYILLGLAFRLAVASFKGQFMEMVKTDPSWGPESELLQRSRGMFTAQAMTKEYMYRQYHLQAGIIARQKKANIRSKVNDEELNIML